MTAEIKPIFGGDDRIRLSDAIPLDTPFTMNIFPTGACNFRCRYCAQSLGKDILREKYHFSYDMMPMNVLEKTVMQMKNFSDSFKLVSFMGHGEPLLHKKLPEMIRIVHDAGVTQRIEIITNGSQLTHALSEQLIDAGLSTLRVSLQGISEKKYWEISQIKLDFSTFLDELRYFYDHKKNCKLYVKVVDTALDEGEEETFYRMFGDISDRMFVEHIKPVYDGVSYHDSKSEKNTDRYGNAHENRMVCPLAFYMIAVWPNGDLVPCDAIYKPIVLGNILRDDLVEMWHGEKLKKFWQLQLEGQRLWYPGCNVCCAPNDVSHPLDALDDSRNRIIEILNKSSDE